MKRDISKILLLCLVILNNNDKNIAKATTRIFAAYRSTNFFRQARLQYRRVFTPEQKPKNSLLPVRNGSDGLFKIIKGDNGFEHRIKNTGNGIYVETFDKNGKLILKSEKSQIDSVTEIINNNKVVNRIIVNNLYEKLKQIN